MKDVFYVIVYYIFKFFVWIIPQTIIYLLAKGFALLFYTVDKKHRKIAHVNLELAYGDTLSGEEKIKIIKETYLNLVLLLVSFIQNQGITKEKLLKKVTFKNENILLDALQSKRKVILITAHYGNWEMLPLSLASKFGPLTGVGRKLDSDIMDNILNQNRQQFDIEMLNKRGAMKSMIQALKNNRMLGLLVDHNTTEAEGLLVDFFGKPVMHTSSTAILARRFDALIIPAYITRDDYPNCTITFYEPIVTEKTEDKDKDILDSVQKQATITEEVIREKPGEWFWLHRRWKNQFNVYYEDKKSEGV